MGRSLAFRLTLWYAGIFTISTVAAFLAFYLLLSSVMEKNRDLDLASDLEEYSSMLATDGFAKVESELLRDAQSDGVGKVFYRLLSLDGEVLASTDMSPWEGIGINGKALGQLTAGGGHVFETVALPGHEYPARIVYGKIGPGTVLQIGESVEEDGEFLGLLREIFGRVVISVMFLATIIGWFMARRALAGIEQVTNTALEISAGTLDRRVALASKGGEVERLATAFNQMLDRINVLIKEMKEMSDNIAHDLRNPLARIRGTAELVLTTNSTPEEFQAMAANTVEECDRLLAVVNTMLDISEVESGVGSLQREEVDVVRLIQQACDLFRPIAEDKKVLIEKSMPRHCILQGDPQKLQRLVANLLDNALKYTGAGGSVRVTLKDDDNHVFISVADTGIGITAADLPHIFDRFYRGDKSRSEPGIGLGLSLVRAIARFHGGDVRAESCPDKGSIFTVTLPRGAKGKKASRRPGIA
ncbi:MAG: HAMP domain-containing protein [Deltaproteobacteria bacterium]|nr:HAMP domain-containing protein [Deltaproteobacteria bacterium]